MVFTENTEFDKKYRITKGVFWKPEFCYLDTYKRSGYQLGLLSINFDFRNVIFQLIVFPFVWAKYKWKFVMDGCKLSLPLPLAALPLARAFSRGLFHSSK